MRHRRGHPARPPRLACSSPTRCRSWRRSRATRRASCATSTRTTPRPGSPRASAPASSCCMTDVDGVRDARRQQARLDHRRRGRGAHRGRHDQRRHGAQGQGAPSPRSRGTTPRRSSRTRSAPDALDRAPSTTRRSAPACPRAPAPARRARWPWSLAKRDRHAAIRRLVAARPIGSQGELVDALSALGFDVTQATVSRDIAELGLAKVMRGDHSVYVNPEALGPAARPAVRRAAAAHPRRHPGHGRAERPDPRPHRPARHRQRHRPGDRRVDAHRAGRHGGRATTRSSSCSPTSPPSSGGSSGSTPCSGPARTHLEASLR